MTAAKAKANAPEPEAEQAGAAFRLLTLGEAMRFATSMSEAIDIEVVTVVELVEAMTEQGYVLAKRAAE